MASSCCSAIGYATRACPSPLSRARGRCDPAKVRGLQSVQRVLPPAPARKASDGTRAGGKDARLPCATPARPACGADCAYLPTRDPQRRAVALRQQKRPRLPFSANLLFFPAKRPRQASSSASGPPQGQARGEPAAGWKHSWAGAFYARRAEGAFSIVKPQSQKVLFWCQLARISKKMADENRRPPDRWIRRKGQGDMTMSTTALTIIGCYSAISAISTAVVLAWGRARARRMER